MSNVHYVDEEAAKTKNELVHKWLKPTAQHGVLDFYLQGHSSLFIGTEFSK